MRILVLNQYYYPDAAATAQRLTELCEELAKRNRIVVVCGRPSYDPVIGSRSASDCASSRVHLVRVPSTAFHRSRMSGRLCNYLTYLVLALAAALLGKTPDLIVAMTDPPIIGAAAWITSTVRRVPFVLVVQDLHPDVGIALNKMSDGFIARLLDRLNRFMFARAAKLIAISESMRRRLVEKGVAASRIVVISNWADVDAIVPGPKINAFSLRHDLSDKFVVMYSGNIGATQNIDQLVYAATDLQAIEDLRVVIVGDGGERSRVVKLAERLQVRNVVFLPYQPVEMLPLSFATADIFVIPLRRGLDGLVVPSKVFPVMASGRPFIAPVEPESEIAALVRRFRCGLVISPDNSEGLRDAIRWSYSARDDLRAMGQRGRDAVVCAYQREIATSKYERVFEHVVTLAGRPHAV